MKKLLLTILVIILAVSMMTACGGGKSGSGGSGSSDAGGGNNEVTAGDDSNDTATPSKNNKHIITDEEENIKDSDSGNDTKASDSGGITTLPDITVNPGDTVFDNEYITLVYNGVNCEGSLWDMTINCTATRKNMDQEISIYHGYDPLVINGEATELYDFSFAQICSKDASNECNVNIDSKSLKDTAGIAIEDVKTVQAKFTVSHIGERDLFEGNVIFNIK